MKTFYNQVAFITGAASGIGRELAVQLARQGVMVVATDVNQTSIDAVADAIRQQGGKADSYRLDVTDCYAVRLLIRRIQDQYGGIDYGFCNAEMNLAGPANELNMDDWERALAVNLNGVLCTATELYKVLVKQKAGCLVNTVSAGTLAPPTGLVPYLTTRHALAAFSQALQQEGREFGVTVTAFYPEMIDAEYPDRSDTASLVTELLHQVSTRSEFADWPIYGKLMTWMNRLTEPFARPTSDVTSPPVRPVIRQRETEPETH